MAASLRQGEWWNPFAPTDFEACSEQAAISAKSVAALNILLNSCHSKFKGRRKDGGGYTYFDERQKRHFDISGPILMADEVRYIDLEYESYTAKAAELERRQQIEQAEVERVSRLREAEAERRDNTRRIELENRRKATATAIRLSAIQVNCHYPSLRDCVHYDLSMTAKNTSDESVSAMSLGWVFMPEDRERCPDAIGTTSRQAIQLRPSETAELRIKGYDGPKSLPPRVCVRVNSVELLE